MTHKGRIPLQKKFEFYRIICALGIALLLTSAILFLTSQAPYEALRALFLSPFSSKRHFFNILEMAIPLTFTGLALSLVFQSGSFSMISDGAFYMGAVLAACLAVRLTLPPVLHPFFILVMSSLAGAVIGLIPAVLRVRFRANELVTSLMLNFVFYYLGLYIIKTFIIDRTAGNFASVKYGSTALLQNIYTGTRLHSGFFIALIAAVLVYLYVYRTKWGYEIRVTGSNPDFARYSGIPAGRVILMAQMAAGAIAGLGGAVEQLGMYTRFLWADAPGYAWDGVILAVLSRNNPKFVPLAAFFLAYIRVGADVMSRRTDIPGELVSVIQAVIILMVTAERFLFFYRQRLEAKQALENS